MPIKVRYLKEYKKQLNDLKVLEKNAMENFKKNNFKSACEYKKLSNCIPVNVYSF